ncbi:transcription initiation factor TFIID subunit 2 [Achlya hypogyna]|uniref:Transcription initiation factor TFIID subunit 2 n=1 Tax=Achlya hypogyna TaxID=1202772 RepID=A0A1V9ZAC2_ACHHY|nr:transcription initiation factor TFIID subunit 2 [Achlya hypogyna]
MMMEYEYLQQRLQLRVDLMEKRLVGVSEIILAPKTVDLKRVRINCRQMKVSRVSVNGVDARFEQLDFLAEIVHESYRDWAAFDLFYRGAIVAAKEGTLVVELPADVERMHGQSSAPSASQSSAEDTDNATDEDTKHAKDNAFWDLDQMPLSTTGFEPLRIRVEYIVENPRGGVRFLLPDDEHPNRSPHMYTYCGPFGGLCDGARMWMPCRDSLKDTCTFRIELIVPAYCVAVCSGRLVDQSVDDAYRSFKYVVNTRTHCSMIGFAVGPFRMYIPEAMPRMTHFCLPEVYEDLVHTTSSVHTSKSNKESTAGQPYPTTSILAFFEGYLNARYPFETYQQVYVEDPPEECQYFAGAAVLDQRSLYGPTIIDRKLPSHLLQVKAFVGSWIAGAIGILTTKDAWVLVGVVGHLVNAYVKVVFGEEECGYRIQLAMDALTTIELTSDAPSLIYPDVDVYGEYDPSYVPFLEAKGPLILHMIEQRVEQRLGPKHLQIALQRIVAGSVPMESYGKSKKENDDDKEKDGDDDGDDGDDGNQSVVNMDEAASSSKAGQPVALSTWSLLSIVKSIAGASGQDLCRSFLQTWIVHGGLPFFSVGFWYNRKQTQAEVVLEQTLLPGCEKYTGNIKITIVEEQSEYVHHKRIEAVRHKWEFPCHSKVRKKRRTRQKLDQSDDDYSSQISGAGMGLNDTPVYWVKIDPECGWLRHIVMYQPDFNWMEQLLSDSKCVRSRVHAARALALYPLSHEKPHVMACRVLTECMHGLTTHSRRLRAEAAVALGLWQSLHAPMTNARTDLPEWKGMHNLFRIFKEHFFDRSADMPLPNYFLPSGGKVVLESVGDAQSTTSRDIQIQDYAEGEYEIKKAIPKALAMVRSRTGFSPPEIETFLLQLLTQNDNSKNYVEMADESSVADDCFYVGSLIMSLSVLVLENRSGRKDTATEILRLLHYDDVRPSYGHTITICCLEALCNLQLAGRLADDTVVPYHKYASTKYPSMVRKAAIESILRLYFAEDPRDEAPAFKKLGRSYGPVAAITYALQLVEVEQSPGVRRFVVQVCLNCLRGFPPSVAAQVLSTWDHAYTLGIMHAIQTEHHGAFLSKSPTKESIAAMFTPPSLAPLREDTLATRAVAELLWTTMNTTAATDQPLRVALSLLYRKIWGDTTPLCLAHAVQEKPPQWAGGYESLRKLIDESRAIAKGMYPGKAKSLDDVSKKRPPSGSPPLTGMAGTFDQLKGKKLKLKLGETIVMSGKL